MSAYLEQRIPSFRSFESDKLKFAAHLHRHVELVLFLEGEAVATVEGARHVLAPGDVFIAFPNQVHLYDPPYTKERSRVLVVDPDMMPELSSALLDSVPRNNCLRGAVTDELLSFAVRLGDLKNPRTPLEQAERHGLLLTLFSRVLGACELTAVRESGSAACRSVLDYCTHHYTEELTLGVLERELHISRYHISHMFAKRLRIGFNDYVNSLRVSHACRYLREDKHSVTEIGSLVGFSNPRTFNRAFLKEMGTTPSQYRKRKDLV